MRGIHRQIDDRFCRSLRSGRRRKGFEVDGNLRAAERHAKDIKAGFTSYDAKKVFHGAGQFIVDFAKIEVKGVANVATKTAKFIDPAASKDLLKISNELRAKSRPR